MTDVVFTATVAAVIVALIGLAVAVRFLLVAWQDVRLRRERRSGDDRRATHLRVPIERRAHDRRG